MPALLKDLKEYLGSTQMEMIGQKLNTTTISARNGINLTLPILIGGLTGNALEETSAKDLYQALTSDHNGSIFDNLFRFLSNHNFQSESGILPHILGDQQSAVVHMVKGKSGLEPNLILQIMELGSVLLMGYIGKELRHHHFDTEELTTFLHRASLQIAKKSPELYAKLNTLFRLERPPQKKIFSFLKRNKNK